MSKMPFQIESEFGWQDSILSCMQILD